MGYVHGGGIGLFRYVFVSLRGGVTSSLPVAIANRIVALTASMFGVHFSVSAGDFPPK